MNDRIDLGRLQDLDDERVADVRSHELGPGELDLGFLEVDADDAGDIRVLLESLSKAAAEEAGDPGDEDALAGQKDSP